MKREPEEEYTIKELLYPDNGIQVGQQDRTGSRDVRVQDLTEKQARDVELSKAIWICNPGYLSLREGTVKSIAGRDYIWDTEEIDYMKSVGLLTQKFNRKRDDFTKYVEAEAQAKKLTQPCT